MKTTSQSIDKYKNGAKSLLAIMLVLTLAFFVLAGEAFATTTHISYKGTGIHNLDSRQKCKISSGKTLKVKHSQTRATGGTSSMTVSVIKTAFLSEQTYIAKTFKNNVSNKIFSGYCPSGNYKLHFRANVAYTTFNIEGKMYS